MRLLGNRLRALEGSAPDDWRHEDWMDYFARKERGEPVDQPRPSPGMAALMETLEREKAQ